MDVSPMGTADLSKHPDPEWEQQQLFLKVLVECKATLYYFEGNALTRFFYSVSGSPIQQLIFKEYYASNEEIAVNNKYQAQLWTDVNCSTISTGYIEQLKYRKSDL